MFALPGVRELAISTEFAECQRLMLAAWTHGVRFGERAAAIGGRSDALFASNKEHRRGASTSEACGHMIDHSISQSF